VELRDRFGREHDDLRVSVTDRCNLRCAYCMPRDPVWFPRDEILSFEEAMRIVRITMRRGVRKVRLTGGEPLVRRDLPLFVQMLAEAGIEDLSLTTNGLALQDKAASLAAAGLRRVNVSLDTLRPDRFGAMTRRPAFERVMRGLDAAAAAGLTPLKINTVLVRGVNDDEAEPLVERARAHGWEVRFIEFMPLDNEGRWDPEQVIHGSELRRRIGERWPIEPEPAADPHAPATRYRFRDGKGHVGFIDSVSAPFCAACTRLRLTSDGMFRVCIYDSAEVDLKTPLRAGAGDSELERLIVDAVRAKGRGGALDVLEQKQALPLGRTMHQIGG
jgi:cyclic pyranopterin phosphate synthase